MNKILEDILREDDTPVDPDTAFREFVKRFYRLVPTDEAHDILWGLWSESGFCHRTGPGRWRWQDETGTTHPIQKRTIETLHRNGLVVAYDDLDWMPSKKACNPSLTQKGEDLMEELFQWLTDSDDEPARELPPRK